MAFKLPSSGYVFWPVGTGDSTTICVNDETVIQVDLHNLAVADDDDDPRTPIVDRLVKLLPKKDGKPYLSLFILTHPDKDHCLGFKGLNTRQAPFIGKMGHLGNLALRPITRSVTLDPLTGAKRYQLLRVRKAEADNKIDGDLNGMWTRVYS